MRPLLALALVLPLLAACRREAPPVTPVREPPEGEVWVYTDTTAYDTLRTALTGRVMTPVVVAVRRDTTGFKTYTFREEYRYEDHQTFDTMERHGTWSFVPVGWPDAVLADLNFDGAADLWVRGCASGGQCRIYESDVWLYDPTPLEGDDGMLRAGGDYVYSSTLSSLAALSVDPRQELLSASIGNCGGAGNCHLDLVYRLVGDRLQLVGRETGSNNPDHDGYGCRTEELREDTLAVVVQSDDPWRCPRPFGFTYLDTSP